jgi:hypothetical protein
MAVPGAGAGGAPVIAVELGGAAAGAAFGAGVIAVEPEGAVAGAAEPSALAAGEPAGAGADVELLHPLNTRAAERAKIAAIAGNFWCMGLSC